MIVKYNGIICGLEMLLSWATMKSVHNCNFETVLETSSWKTKEESDNKLYIRKTDWKIGSWMDRVHCGYCYEMY
jgi:hypothetical protein